MVKTKPVGLPLTRLPQGGPFGGLVVSPGESLLSLAWRVLRGAVEEVDKNEMSTHAPNCRHIRKAGRPGECDCWLREAREIIALADVLIGEMPPEEPAFR